MEWESLDLRRDFSALDLACGNVQKGSEESKNAKDRASEAFTATCAGPSDHGRKLNKNDDVDMNRDNENQTDENANPVEGTPAPPSSPLPPAPSTKRPHSENLYKDDVVMRQRPRGIHSLGEREKGKRECTRRRLLRRDWPLEKWGGGGQKFKDSELVAQQQRNQEIQRRQFWGVLPFVLNAYIQTVFNVILVATVLYCIWAFVFAVQHDIDSKVQLTTLQAVHESYSCAAEYHKNKCLPAERVPALEEACNEWEMCMKRDADRVSKKSSLSAQTVGETINVFLEQLSWKSAGLLACGFLCIFVGSNCALSLARGPLTPDSHDPSAALAESHLGFNPTRRYIRR